MSSTQTELIENYLAGSLPDKERILFEQALASDPVLHQEFLLQKDIIEGIRQQRRVELKTRLDQVTPQTGWQPFTQLAGLKLAGAVFGLLAVSTLVYLGLDTPQENTDDQVNLTLSGESIGTIWQPERPIPVTAPKPSNTLSNTPQETEEIALPAEGSSTPIAKETTPPESEPVATSRPSFSKPQVITDFDDSDVVVDEAESGVGAEQLAGDATTEIEAMEVTTTESKRHSFHYQFFNNKLYLYGDFNNVPYEILELNHLSGKSHYLFYRDTYYPIGENTQEVTPLIPIEDEQLIKELSIIRKNKSLH